MARTQMNAWGTTWRPRSNTKGVSGGGFGGTFAQPQDYGQLPPGMVPNTAPPAFNANADFGYIAGSAAIGQQLRDAEDQLAYGRLSGAQSFGYDASGGLASGAGYNPYSQAAILQRNYDNTKRGSVNSYAAMGQLYSGALKNKQADDSYNYSRSDDALRRAAQDYFKGLDFNYQGVKTAGQAKTADLLLAAYQNFLNSQRG